MIKKTHVTISDQWKYNDEEKSSFSNTLKVTLKDFIENFFGIKLD